MTMSATVLLPISDWRERLIGKRLVTASPCFISDHGAKVFHNEPIPSSLTLSTTKPFPDSSPLLLLPAELRFHILANVLKDLQPDDWLSAHHHVGATPASVIFTCKQLYIDGRQLALEACTFDYEELPVKRRMVGYYNGIEDNYHCER